MVILLGAKTMAWLHDRICTIYVNVCIEIDKYGKHYGAPQKQTVHMFDIIYVLQSELHVK